MSLMHSSAVPLALKRSDQQLGSPTLRQVFFAHPVAIADVSGGELSWDPDGPGAAMLRAALRKRKESVPDFLNVTSFPSTHKGQKNVRSTAPYTQAVALQTPGEVAWG
jgi:hypothetical protein